MSAHVITDETKRIDSLYAELISQRRDRDAMAPRADTAFAVREFTLRHTSHPA
jgi:hypothetical protein